MAVPENIGAWKELPFFKPDQDGKTAWDRLSSFLAAETNEGRNWQPHWDKIFRALELTKLEDVRVVILGRDPYFIDGLANGLAFSQNAPPPNGSVAKIFAELRRDLGVHRTNPCLDDWAVKGVLLLNRSLSVMINIAGSHENSGWEPLIEQVIGKLSERGNCVFIAWGVPAADLLMRVEVEQPKNLLIQTRHPTASRGNLPQFQGSKPFSAANNWLEAKGLARINWGNQ